jgi:hypothetical protein
MGCEWFPAWLGITLALLDFEDGRDFEVGLGGR